VRVLGHCLTVPCSSHTSPVFFGLRSTRVPPPICLRPLLPLLARSSLRYAPCALPAGPLGISGRSTAATSPCSLATHWHHCQINRSLALSPPQLGTVRQQPDCPRSLPLSPVRPPHLRQVRQPVEALRAPPRGGQLPDQVSRHEGVLAPVWCLPHRYGQNAGAVTAVPHPANAGRSRQQ
jgi:hypothetical protein